MKSNETIAICLRSISDDTIALDGMCGRHQINELVQRLTVRSKRLPALQSIVRLFACRYHGAYRKHAAARQTSGGAGVGILEEAGWDLWG